MTQIVKANDKHKSQLFQWDTERNIISLPHGKEIWYAELSKDNHFVLLESKPKPKQK